MKTIELTELEARALRTVIFAIKETAPGAQLKRKLYDWQLESLDAIETQVQ